MQKEDPAWDRSTNIHPIGRTHEVKEGPDVFVGDDGAFLVDELDTLDTQSLFDPPSFLYFINI